MEGADVGVFADRLGLVLPRGADGDALGIEDTCSRRGVREKVVVAPHDGVAELQRQGQWCKAGRLHHDGVCDRRRGGDRHADERR